MVLAVTTAQVRVGQRAASSSATSGRMARRVPGCGGRPIISPSSSSPASAARRESAALTAGGQA
ncbi:MAG: hypothetical protein DYH19_02855 [Gammaproteobacteria bacterium PRO8]|nr:hypothetical protein [Gammaproteobacteria bacterium PRO8]MCQ3933893.1 hypothetical protein [Gammaproteobacteria bacterium]